VSEEILWCAIQRDNYVNGPGPRTVLWLVGCPIHCPGCQNEHLWSPSSTTARSDPRALAIRLLDLAGDQPLTITGGEPFYQADALFLLLANIRLDDHFAGRRREIVVYSGYTWEDLLDLDEATTTIACLRLIDILVDGPYIRSQDDRLIQWRGSRNQRVIDVQASIDNGALNEPARSLHGDANGDDHLVFLDWDVPTISVTANGLVGAGGLMEMLFEDADLEPVERCGEIGG
jgi:organic radical activating enzyme